MVSSGICEIARWFAALLPSMWLCITENAASALILCLEDNCGEGYHHQKMGRCLLVDCIEGSTHQSLHSLEAGGVSPRGMCMFCECVRNPGTKAKHFLVLFSSIVMAGGAGHELSRLPCISNLNNSFQILFLRSTSANHCPHMPGLDSFRK
ncbi:uncharacterized protein ACIBXB_007418 [Morphnus guianensis]